MNENMAKYLKLLRKNLDRVMLGVMTAFFLAMLAIWWIEQNSSTADPPAGTLVQLDDAVEKNPLWATVKELAVQRPIDQLPAIKQIRTYNMFDYKTVQQSEDLQKKVNTLTAQALEAQKGGRLDEAKRLAKDILDLKPTHGPARKLLDELEPPAGTKPGAGKPSAPGAQAAPGTPVEAASQPVR